MIANDAQADTVHERFFDTCERGYEAEKRLFFPLLYTCSFGFSVVAMALMFYYSFQPGDVRIPDTLLDTLNSNANVVSTVLEGSYTEARDQLKSLGLEDQPGAKYLLGQIARRDGVKLEPSEWQAAIDDIQVEVWSEWGSSFYRHEARFVYDAERAAYGAPQSSVGKAQAERLSEMKWGSLQFVLKWFGLPALICGLLLAVRYNKAKRIYQKAKGIYDQAYGQANDEARVELDNIVRYYSKISRIFKRV